MDDESQLSGHERRVANAATTWVIREDRGLTAPEQDEFSTWLAESPAHRVAYRRHTRVWHRFDSLVAPAPELSARASGRKAIPTLPHARTFMAGMAAAVLGGVIFWHNMPIDSDRHPASVATSAYEKQILNDGSILELAQGSKVEVLYSPTERRVRLVRGQAHFTVTKDVTRPFWVEARGVELRAVGTAFAVRFDQEAVRVLVTEGKVQVRSGDSAQDSDSLILAARESAVVSLRERGSLPSVETVTDEAIALELAWRPRSLEFVNAPLNEVVAAFNLHNQVKLIVGDPRLNELRLVAVIRTDNIERFLRMMEASTGIRAERRGDAIILRKGD